MPTRSTQSTRKPRGLARFLRAVPIDGRNLDDETRRTSMHDEAMHDEAALHTFVR